MAAPVYATRAQLVASVYVPSTVTVPADPEATRLLGRASRRIDTLLLRAVYEVDDNDVPTDTAVAEALREATCAQAAWWLELGDESGAAAQFQTVGVGSLNLGRGYTGGGSATGPAQTTSAAAVEVLQQAGLILHEPLTL